MSQGDKIIAQLQTQQHQAIAELYDSYGNALFGVILKIVRSKELAEQVLQDTFIKAWKNGPSYDQSKGKLFTWLLNIARNTAIDATRTAYYKYYQRTDDVAVIYDQPSAAEFNPDQLGLRELVGKMDEKYRVLIELIYFKGYTRQEIEQELGIPLGTVKTRLRFAISELRKAFGNDHRGEVMLLIIALEQFDHFLKG